MTDTIKLNVGGVLYQTTKDTLTKDSNSTLSSMFSGRHPLQQDENGYYFIDRDGKLFEYILKFLRDDKIYLKNIPDVTLECILDEANYYCLSGLITLLESKLEEITLDDNTSITSNTMIKICSAKGVDVKEFEKQFNEHFTIEYVFSISKDCFGKKCKSDEESPAIGSSGLYYTLHKPDFYHTANYDFHRKKYNFLKDIYDKIDNHIFSYLFSKNVIKTNIKCVYELDSSEVLSFRLYI
jgi:hypothetical protein